ncbi:RluA family pseudouridine synthase [Desulfosarcina sp. OttesenSCG-928-A07]|nr:RluA family pseudouridine synthase [Desulfosarcina sp. OttesenSCG-928-G17]MDL2329387.1 RluA family pseudouridine synthase [Desulfosarcina sp. OttesenSCG-928-A07]
MPNPPVCFSFQVDQRHSGIRLDTFVAGHVEACSRSLATALIRQGRITVDGVHHKPGYTVKSGEIISGTLPDPASTDVSPEAIPMVVLYEDQDMLIVNKAPGMVVHPGPGHSGGTLVNALMHHFPELTDISETLRPGIVHRLDKDTSGVLVVAKTDRAMDHFSDQFKTRNVRKHYLALIYGTPDALEGTISLPIGRHPTARKKMSVKSRSPREAQTFWRIKSQFSGISLLELNIRTGRTHQIRVHCQAMGHPVVGDPVYGHREAKRWLAQSAPETARMISDISRQMLHAWKIEIQHPADNRIITARAPLPEDMAALIRRLSTTENKSLRIFKKRRNP